MKAIYMAVTIDLIEREQLRNHIDYINASAPEIKETKDGVRYLVINPK